MFGYNNCNGLLMAGPYDLASNDANMSFDTANGESYHKPKILPPEQMKNQTRWGHNEFSNERLIYDKESNTLKKRMPDYIIWVDEIEYENEEEKKIEREKDDRWRMTKKAAVQLGIPIIVINRERCIKKNKEELKELINQFLKEKNKSELVRKIITKFENNVISMMYAKKDLKLLYFTKEDRISILKIIEDELQQLKILNPNEYKKCIISLAETLYGEIENNCGKEGDGERLNEYIKLFKEHNDEIEQYDIEGYSEITIELSEEKRKKVQEALECVDELGVYKENKRHSISHISKVVLFAEILAQNEETTEEETKIIRAVAAFHDSARNGQDGNKEHAKEGAEFAGEYFKDNPENTFEISDELIGVVQVAIHYHEYSEKSVGVTDEEEIKKLAQKYGVSDYDFSSLKRICEIIKDADALDRTRFANQGTLDPRFLKTKTAKSGKMIMYAIQLNQSVARKILQESYGLTEEDLNPSTENVPSFFEEKDITEKKNEIDDDNYDNVAFLMQSLGFDLPQRKKSIKSDPVLILKEKREEQKRKRKKIEADIKYGRKSSETVIDEKEIELQELIELFELETQNTIQNSTQRDITESKQELLELYEAQNIRTLDLKRFTTNIRENDQGGRE